MSSSTLTTIQNQLNFYGYLIFMILGNIGNLFILFIFNRQRQSACSIYLICSAVMNIIFLTFNGFFLIFPVYYDDGTAHGIILCRIYIYILNIFGQEGRTMIVLACMDRFLITSNRVSFRAFSTPKRAKYLIPFSFIFWLLFLIFVPIMRIVVDGRCTTSGVYTIIYTLYSIIFICLIPSITSAIFGFLSYRNMRQVKNRVQPVGQNTTNGNIFIQRRDRDLLIIVIAQVFFYVVTTALFPLIQLEMMISKYVIPNKSSLYSQIETLILNIAVLLLFINSAAPFYTYLVSSKSFRGEFTQLIINIYRKLRRQPPIQIDFRRDRILTQRQIRI
jgi:hypothetical protein